MKLRILIMTVLLLFGPRFAAPIAAESNSILPLSLLEISSIETEGTNVVVTVNVSANFKRVTLEGKARVNGTWEPVAVERPGEFTTQVKVITFRLPRNEKMELLRVRGDETEALRPELYTGTSTFGVPTSSNGNPPPTAGPGGAGTGAPNAGADTAAPNEQKTPNNGSSDGSRSVVESDIWKISGDTLYFFNQYRGLQVIDISKPDAPTVKGTLHLPAAGEQMYLLNESQVVLLAHDNCSSWSGDAESEVILVEIENGEPNAKASLSVPGSIRESRLVGSALYVVSERYKSIRVEATTDQKAQEYWEWGSDITSFDLSNFDEPKKKSSQWVPGFGNAIMATDRFLFVATPPDGHNWWSTIASLVHVYDISSPDGTMKEMSVIKVGGRVKDKFKMHLSGDTFTVVTENWEKELKTLVETFSLATPTEPKALGNLVVIEREQLYATRFDGDLLYAVTFLRIDPLWIIDLSDPTNPKKVGELEIPGYSTYIYPWDGRLVTVGIEPTNGWRTIVQLFDVEDPAKPSLVSKVFLGERHSYSEATHDEKAFGVLPEENLILVPYSTWDHNSQVQAVQLIDLERDGLTKRGAIDHSFQARRATVHRDRILSISGTELLTVDANDRDKPRVTASTELAWPADRLFLSGEHLVTLAFNEVDEPLIRITDAEEPTDVLNRVSLSKLPILGSTVRGDKLYILQGKSTEVIWPAVWNPTNFFPLSTNHATLKLSVFDLSKLPEMPKLGEEEQSFEDSIKYWGTFKALWPKESVLVWSPGTMRYWYGRPMPIATLAADAGVSAKPAVGGVGGGVSSDSIWWGGYSGIDFVAYDVSNSSAPEFASEISLKDIGVNYWGFSDAFATNGLVYISHQTSVFVPHDRTTAAEPAQTGDGKDVAMPVEPHPGFWYQKYFLDVINYENPEDPSVRKPVNIPGQLIGISHGGEVLYTQSGRYNDPVRWEGWQEMVDVSSYDGVEVHLIDSIDLPKTWPHPVVVDQGRIYFGRPTENNTEGTLEVWALGESGKLSRLSETSLKAAAQNLKVINDLLVVQSNRTVYLFDVTSPTSIKLIGSGEPEGCLWFDLEGATGDRERGLWIPLGVYGVIRIEP